MSEFLLWFYYGLQYFNLVVGIMGVIFYIIGANRSHSPWKAIRYIFAFNLATTVLVYISLIGGRPIEPVLLRGATTLLILTVTVSGFMGMKRHAD